MAHENILLTHNTIHKQSLTNFINKGFNYTSYNFDQTLALSYEVYQEPKAGLFSKKRIIQKSVSNILAAWILTL